jgi:hypothetical protein
MIARVVEQSRHGGHRGGKVEGSTDVLFQFGQALEQLRMLPVNLFNPHRRQFHRIHHFSRCLSPPPQALARQS